MRHSWNSRRVSLLENFFEQTFGFVYWVFYTCFMAIGLGIVFLVPIHQVSESLGMCLVFYLVISSYYFLPRLLFSFFLHRQVVDELAKYPHTVHDSCCVEFFEDIRRLTEIDIAYQFSDSDEEGMAVLGEYLLVEGEKRALSTYQVTVGKTIETNYGFRLKIQDLDEDKVTFTVQAIRWGWFWIKAQRDKVEQT